MIALISWAAGGALVDCQGCHGASLMPNTLKKIFLTLLEDCCDPPALFRVQAVKKFAHRFLNISCSGREGGELLFYLVNLKLISRPMWASNCKRICRHKLFDIDKTYDFVIKPLKI